MKSSHLDLNENILKWERMRPLVFVYVMMILIWVASGIFSHSFFEEAFIENLLRRASFLGIASLGQTLTIIAGGFDFSIAQTITFANIIASDIIMGHNEKTLPAAMIVLLIGTAIGLFNGLGVHYLKIPPMIMTLGAGTVVYGLAYIYSGGAPQGSTSPVLENFANGKLNGVVNGVLLIWVILGVFTVLVMKYTTYGRKLYAVGVNPVAARYSGTPIARIIISTYVISGVCAALTGFLLLGYTGTSYFTTGDSYGMDTIAAVVLGGTAIEGGKGGYAGTFAGAIMMTIIISVLTMINIPVGGRMMVQGFIIVLLIVVVNGRNRSATV